jgi:flagellar protein FlaG
MLVEPVTASGKDMSLSVQAKPTADQEAAQRDDSVKKSVQAVPDLSELSELASDVQKNIDIIHNVGLQFSVNNDSGRIVVTVMDEDTGEVIRQIPPSEFVKFAGRFDEMVGMIFDEKG